VTGVFDFIAMCLVRELLNDVSVDMNMDVTHAESYTHNRQTRRRKKVVNTLYEETAEKINAKQPNRAKKIRRRRRRWCIKCY
jgi:hypoxanthine-guanine phosphoribosyltransferase